ncbi:MAG: hypothetical protein EBZ74_12155 [Planctomycetia bacterium]|nr:hypothetical protein [Planctomycetia bacterium]
MIEDNNKKIKNEVPNIRILYFYPQKNDMTDKNSFFLKKYFSDPWIEPIALPETFFYKMFHSDDKDEVSYLLQLFSWLETTTMDNTRATTSKSQESCLVIFIFYPYILNLVYDRKNTEEFFSGVHLGKKNIFYLPYGLIKKERKLPPIFACWQPNIQSFLRKEKETFDYVYSPELFIANYILISNKTVDGLFALLYDNYHHQKYRIFHLKTRKYPLFLIDYAQVSSVQSILMEWKQWHTFFPPYYIEFQKEIPNIVVITMTLRKQFVKQFLETVLFLHAKIFSAKTFYRPNLYLTKGQINCFMSHITVLQTYQDHEKPLLILEDDIYLPFREVIKRKWIGEEILEICKSLPTNWDIFFLGKCWDFCSTNKKINKKTSSSYSRSIYQVYYPLCSHAYMIRKKAIHILLKEYDTMRKQSDGITMPYDVFLKRMITKKNLQAFSTSENIFSQDPFIEGGSFLQKLEENCFPICIEEKASYLFIIVFIILTILVFLLFLTCLVVYVLRKMK